jgi:hypothetical protein
MHVDTTDARAHAGIVRKTNDKHYPTDLTDEEWEHFAPLLPKPSRRGRRPGVAMREVWLRLRCRNPRGTIRLRIREIFTKAAFRSDICSQPRAEICGQRLRFKPPSLIVSGCEGNPQST